MKVPCRARRNAYVRAVSSDPRPLIAFRTLNVDDEGHLCTRALPGRNYDQATGRLPEIDASDGPRPWLADAQRESAVAYQTVIAAVSADGAELAQDGYLNVTGEQLLAIYCPRSGSFELAQRAADRYQIPVVPTGHELVKTACRHGRMLSPVQGRSMFRGAARLSATPAAGRLADFAMLFAGVGLIMLAGRISVLGVPVTVLLTGLTAGAFLLLAAPQVAYDLWMRFRYSTGPGERFWHSGRHASADTRPLYPHALIGYRVWSLSDDGRLLPAAAVSARRKPNGTWEQLKGDISWTPGRNVAACLEDEHPAPSADCHCGFNCYSWPADAWNAYGGHGRVLGAVIAGGNVQLHATGFRAQLAAPFALVMPREQESRTVARRAAQRYQVPLLRSRRTLIRFARSSGALPLPRAGTPHWHPMRLVGSAVAAALSRTAWAMFGAAAVMVGVCALSLYGLVANFDGVSFAVILLICSSVLVCGSLIARLIALVEFARVNSRS